MTVLVALLLGAASREERFNDLLRTYAERPPAQTFLLVERLVDEGPFEGRDRAEYWMGSARLASGDRQGARRWFARVLRDFPGTAWQERSWLGLGDACAQERDYAAAASWYGRAGEARDPAVRELARMGGRRMLLLRRRQLAAWAALAISLGIAAFFGLSAYRARAPLRPLPAETRVVLPVLAVLSLLSVRVDAGPRLAVLELCASGAALSFLSGLRLRALRLAPGGRALHAALSLLALSCMAYVAVHGADLVGMVQETFRAGPE